jgi:hypothetical protein
MIPAAIEVVGGVRVAEQAGEPETQIPGVDRHHDVAFVVDHILERRQGIAPLTQNRVVDQALLATEIAAVEGHAEVVARRRLPVDSLALHEQMRARTVSAWSDRAIVAASFIRAPLDPSQERCRA